MDKIILGIDPGTTITGYGILQVTNNKPAVLAIGYLDLSKYDDHYLKLQRIFERVLQLIDQYHPDELAIEAPFYDKNIQSMLKLGRAQGVAIAACLYRSIPIYEYMPRKIKSSITGNGNASKEQVALLLKNILQINDMPQNLDASDGLAVAMCHYYQKIFPVDALSKKVSKNWKDFIKNNPERIKIVKK